MLVYFVSITAPLHTITTPDISMHRRNSCTFFLSRSQACSLEQSSAGLVARAVGWGYVVTPARSGLSFTSWPSNMMPCLLHWKIQVQTRSSSQPSWEKNTHLILCVCVSMCVCRSRGGGSTCAPGDAALHENIFWLWGMWQTLRTGSCF